MGARVASSPLRLWYRNVPAVCAPSLSSNQIAIFGTPSSRRQSRSQSCEFVKARPRSVRRACSASSDFFSDEEFSDQIHELTRRLGDEFASSSGDDHGLSREEATKPEWEDESNFMTSMEQKARCLDLPISVRMLKRKLQWQEGFREAGEPGSCSIKAAFSSMVFIVREIQSYTLLLRANSLYEDIQSLLSRVQEDMHESFVWLFQRVFSQTPNLMVYLMILLANYSVHSMACSPAIAAQLHVEAVSVVEIQDFEQGQVVSSPSKTFSTLTPSSSGRSTSFGGRDGGGGGNFPPAVSGTDGEGHFGQSGYRELILPNGYSVSSSLGSMTEEEVDLWNSIVADASEMQSAARDEALDRETMANFVSPVTAEIEADTEYSEYLRTEVLYQIGVSQDPSNQLLLANYAQFLYLVVHDYDRAEEYFKKAVAVEPLDAEAFNKYATFLWRVRNDLWAAEENFLEAISADPANSVYAANYAHFLWNTGGEDTCFPLASSDQDNSHPQQA